MNKILKKILSLTLVFLLAFGSVSVAGAGMYVAEAIESKTYGISSENDITSSAGNFIYRIKEDNGSKSASIVKYTGSATDVSIDSVIDNLPVTEILDGAFKGAKTKWVRVFGNDVVIHPEAFASSDVTHLIINAEKSKLLGLKNCFKIKTVTVNSKQSEISVDGASALEKVICGGKVEDFSGVSDCYKPRIITFTATYPNKTYLDIKSMGYRYKKDQATKEETFYLYEDEDIVLDEETGFSYYVNSSGSKAVIVGYKGERENVTIPDELGGKPVCEIADGAFKGMAFIRNVVLGKNVKRIGHSAFKNCQWLSKITFNENLEIIGVSAFEECEALKEITLPDKVKEINARTFYNCGMVPVVIAKGVEKIGAEAFANDDGYTSLATVEFSRNLHTVEYAAFRGCGSLTSIGVSGKKITTIGESAFEKAGIKSFTFSSELKEIPYKAFAETGLEEVTLCEGMEKIGGFEKTRIRKIILPSTVKVIENSAFEGCTRLKEVVFPDGLEEIGDKAFYRCSSLELESFPVSLTYIGESTFALCNQIGNSITIPEKVTFIGSNAFSQTGIRELYFNAAYCSEINGIFDNVITAIIGENVTRIPDSLFKNCSSLETVVIPESVTEIGASAFSYCKNLEEINLPGTVTYIGESAFYYCEKLEEITIPEGVTTFDNSAIEGCLSLKTVYFNAVDCTFTGLHDLLSYRDIVIGKKSPFSVTENVNIVLGDKVKAVPAYMYSGINNIENIILPSSVTHIGEDAFAHSSIREIRFSDKLESIGKKAFFNTDVRISDNKFPVTLMTIGEQAFRNCDELTEVYIPDTIVSIGDYAFCSCDNLAKVRMAPDMKTISAFAFAECSNLSEFIWEAETKVIGKDAFRNCKNLTCFDFESVEKVSESSFVGSGVKSVHLGVKEKGDATDRDIIEVATFENCTNLEMVSVGGNISTIRSAAFANCSALEIAIISPSVTNIAKDAFDGCTLLTIYCAEDSYAHEYALVQGIPVSTFYVEKIPAQSYSGEEIRPDVTVKISDETLAENVDFTLDFSDNINAGIAKVHIDGKGKYKGFTYVAEFEIATKSVENITVSHIGNQVYTGNEVKPELTIYNGDKVLTGGVDYIVTYKNNTEAGTATAEITGIGNYSGKTTVTFEIVKQTFWQKIVSFFRMIFNAIRDFFTSIFG